MMRLFKRLFRLFSSGVTDFSKPYVDQRSVDADKKMNDFLKAFTERVRHEKNIRSISAIPVTNYLDGTRNFYTIYPIRTAIPDQYSTLASFNTIGMPYVSSKEPDQFTRDDTQGFHNSKL